MSDEKTYDMQPSPLAATGVYTPLRFQIGGPSGERARYVAAMILNRYRREPQTYTKWRAAKGLTVTWSDGKGQQRTSKPLRFEWLVEHLREREQFVPEELGLPPLEAGWLDQAFEVRKPFHAPESSGLPEALTFVFVPPLSPSFPVQPKLDREGRAFSSMQLMLLQSWVDLHARLVETSHLLFEGYDWLRDLFMYVSTIVSTVDNTLHQIYYRAQYEAAVEGWSFDVEKLGPPTARRIVDKFRWINLITGYTLDGCESQMEKFIFIKDIRNHLAHFDPPTLAFTIEDVAEWLNATHEVAVLLAGIRTRINQPPCHPLIRLLLARRVEWYPSDPGKRRVPQGPHIGYASSCRPT